MEAQVPDLSAESEPCVVLALQGPDLGGTEAAARGP